MHSCKHPRHLARKIQSLHRDSEYSFQTVAYSSCGAVLLSPLGLELAAGTCRRVRISLGLKPLSMENSADTRRKEFDARQKVQAEQEKEAQAAALLERVQK